ncbi:MAG: hypothetical protein ACI8U3_001288 [Brevundimonas sp.]|jgi:hypothetical protein|uniref:DUF3800 domain-containing protein n=1 Tax=Brevundimonas sp. TaxID=1871086 RepID=UPI0039E4D067
MTTPLYFDESGYTGRQLMDPLQRHFVLASSRISDETAKALMQQSFPAYQGDEFKFEKIWNRPRSRRRLPEFVRAVGVHAEDLYVWQIDKRFSLLIKMLEYLVEPDLYEAGFDWYSGFGYRVSNHFQFGLTHVARKGLYEDTLAAYYAFARKPTDEGLGILAKALVSLSRRAPKEIRHVFNACGMGVANFHRHHDMGTFKDTLEVYVTSMLNAVGYWAQRGLTDLELHHDESSAFFRQSELWASLTSPTVAAQLHPVLNGPPIAFPLPVAATISRKSEESPGVQLCDLVAGLSVKLFTREVQSDEALVEALKSGGFGEITTNGVTPGTDFPEGPPPRRVGKDAVDKMVDLIHSGQSQS